MSTLGQGDFELAVRQQPKYACVAIGKGKGNPPCLTLLSFVRRSGFGPANTRHREETDRPSTHRTAHGQPQKGPGQDISPKPIPHPDGQTDPQGR